MEKRLGNKAFFAVLGGMLVLLVSASLAVRMGALGASEKTKFPYLRPVPAKKAASADFRLRIPIVMYHYVEVVQNPRDRLRQKMDVQPSAFEAQLSDLVRRGYAFYFVKDLPALLRGDGKPAPRSIALTFDDGYEDFYADVFPLLKKYGAKATLYVMNDFLGKPGYVTEEQVKEIIKSGLVEIGSHTLDHADLRSLPAAEARRQIADNKRELEGKFGIPVETFAYPYGRYATSTPELVKEAGYTAAVTTRPGEDHSLSGVFLLTRERPGILISKQK